MTAIACCGNVEQMLKETSDVESCSRRTGLQLGLAITEPNTGDFLVSSPSPVEIRLFSEDTVALHRTAKEVAASISKVRGVVDVFDGIVVSGPAITFRIDPQRAAMYGVKGSDVTDTVTADLGGTVASSIVERGHAVDVRVLLPSDQQTSLDRLRALRVLSPVSGTFVRVYQVATIEYEPGQTEIARDELRQTNAVTARLEGISLGTAIQQIQAQLQRDVHLPPGMTLEYGGLYQEQQASFRQLAVTPTIYAIVSHQNPQFIRR